MFCVGRGGARGSTGERPALPAPHPFHAPFPSSSSEYAHAREAFDARLARQAAVQAVLSPAALAEGLRAGAGAADAESTRAYDDFLAASIGFDRC